ncbi:MAG: caspase family protein [Rhizobiaceae bacterium]|nr:caspase family protein [Rhizobiaceae bacterium]
MSGKSSSASSPFWRVLACCAFFLGAAAAFAPVSFAGVELPGDELATRRAADLDMLRQELSGLPPIMPGAPPTGKRRAFVVGNDEYAEIDRLQKAEGDARSIAEALKALDFTVSLHENLKRDDFDDALEAFYGTLQEGDTAVFFYSGHGIALDGVNYLLPVDMPAIEADDARKVRREAVDATEIVGTLADRGVQLALVVLDACRDDPFARDGTRGAAKIGGLAPIQPNKGVFVIYSAGVGEKALDRLGPGDADPNSIFTRKFMPILETPGLPLVDIAKRTQVEVRALAQQVRHTQAPAYYDQVVGQYYFQPPSPKLYGIAIGIDEYVGYRLRGAVNDAERVARAIEALGAEKIVRLFDRNANVQFIDYVWRDMLEDANPGDTIVLSYAGASLQMPDPTGEEEDGWQEALTLGNFDFPAARADRSSVDPDSVISDDELTRWMALAADRNVNVVLFVDGCDAGGLLDREFANVSFIGSSAEGEVVKEYEVEGRAHGLASVAFAAALEGAADYNGDGFITQRELYHHVADGVFQGAGLQQNPQFLPVLNGEAKDGSDRATDMALFRLPVDVATRVKAALEVPYPGDRNGVGTR